MLDYRFCPWCGSELERSEREGRTRQVCPAAGCGFVHWDNPTPVVAAIIEHEGQVLLARNRAWPEKKFGLVTGFLERGETPETGVLPRFSSKAMPWAFSGAARLESSISP